MNGGCKALNFPVFISYSSLLIVLNSHHVPVVSGMIENSNRWRQKKYMYVNNNILFKSSLRNRQTKIQMSCLIGLFVLDNRVHI